MLWGVPVLTPLRSVRGSLVSNSSTSESPRLERPCTGTLTHGGIYNVGPVKRNGIRTGIEAKRYKYRRVVENTLLQVGLRVVGLTRSHTRSRVRVPRLERDENCSTHYSPVKVLERLGRPKSNHLFLLRVEGMSQRYF